MQRMTESGRIKDKMVITPSLQLNEWVLITHNEHSPARV